MVEVIVGCIRLSITRHWIHRAIVAGRARPTEDKHPGSSKHCRVGAPPGEPAARLRHPAAGLAVRPGRRPHIPPPNLATAGLKSSSCDTSGKRGRLAGIMTREQLSPTSFQLVLCTSHSDQSCSRRTPHPICSASTQTCFQGLVPRLQLPHFGKATKNACVYMDGCHNICSALRASTGAHVQVANHALCHAGCSMSHSDQSPGVARSHLRARCSLCTWRPTIDAWLPMMLKVLSKRRTP